MHELICPDSGEPCEFVRYCVARKEALEENGGLADALIERLPGVVCDVIDEAGFCPNERIGGLIDLAGSVDDDSVSAQARGLAAQTVAARDMFRNPGAEAV